MTTIRESAPHVWPLAIAVGSIALLMLGLQPLVLGALLESGRVSLEGVGLVAMAEIVGLGAGVLLGDLVLPLGRLRLATAIAALIGAGLNVATLHVAGDLVFSVIRAAAGIGEGVLVWSTTSVLVRTSRPERKAGIFFVVQTAAQGLVGLALAQLVVPGHGWQGAFVALAVLSCGAAVLAAGLPAGLRPLAAVAVDGFAWSIRHAMPLVVSFLLMATLGSLWAYIEPLGQRAGFGTVAIQTLIAAGLGMQVIGGCIGSVLVRRIPVRPTLSLCALLLGLSAYGIGRTIANDTTAFALLCAVFTFVWLFAAPFQMALAFAADTTGRVASLVPAAQLFGVAFGPLMASFVVEGEQAGKVPLVSVAFSVLTGIALLRGHAPRSERAPSV